jgi:hypothetical protein
MNYLNIREIRWLERDVCAIVFVGDSSDDEIKTLARLQRGRSVIAVSYDDDVTKEYQGGAAGLQAIVHAITTFCLAAQGELKG